MPGLDPFALLPPTIGGVPVEALAAGLVGLSIVTLVGAAIGLPVVLAEMPADYFTREGPPPGSMSARHPAVRLGIKIARNAMGAVLAVAGFLMLFVPGQGLLTLFAALTLLDVPGKRAVELRCVRIGAFRRAVDALRARAHKPPLELPPR